MTRSSSGRSTRPAVGRTDQGVVRRRRRSTAGSVAAFAVTRTRAVKPSILLSSCTDLVARRLGTPLDTSEVQFPLEAPAVFAGIRHSGRGFGPVAVTSRWGTQSST
jgi:hypothetical protein